MDPKFSLTRWLLLGAVVPAMLVGTRQARADDDRGRGAVKLLKTVPLPAGNRLVAFDISWVDAETQLYYLADRSDKAIDVVDAKRNVFVRQIKANFKGATGDNDTSGPNGVVVSGNFLFVTDADSRVVAIDLRTDQVVGEANTGHTPGSKPGARADELAFDPEDGLILAVNNADDPPFATLVKVDSDGHLTTGKRITFADATDGAEQPIWDARLGRFFISIPELNGDVTDGAVARINPDGTLETMFHVSHCKPGGLTLGPHQDLLIGCSVVFDTAGKPWSASGTTTAAPTQVIMDAGSGAIDRVVAGVGGSDEVWFNPGDGRYYTASRNNPGGPVLGVIDAESQTLVQVVPTVNKAPGSAHSVAVNPHNNHAIVPLPANNVFPRCLDGCFAVFGSPGDEDRD
jgi:hypothetical protein